jgi:hypothetical protein
MVTMPTETVPGEEFQFYWSDCNSFARRWGWGPRTALLWLRAVLEPDQVLFLRPRSSVPDSAHDSCPYRSLLRPYRMAA